MHVVSIIYKSALKNLESRTNSWITIKKNSIHERYIGIINISGVKKDNNNNNKMML